MSKEEDECRIIYDFIKMSMDMGAEIIINGNVVVPKRVLHESRESDLTQERKTWSET